MDILIVEGKHDYERIKRLFPNLLIITTNGSETSENTINLIKEYAKNNEIIIFTDPDYPGERIRKKIKNICPKAKEVFINKNKCISKNKKKVGVEHASDKDLLEALSDIKNTNINKRYDLKTLINLGLALDNDSKLKREYLANKLNIGKPNVKTLINRLNSFNIDINKVKEILDNYGRES